MTDHPCRIEGAFRLKQASLDSVHEKSVRYGHILTLHVWPARRPLAACRAALIARPNLLFVRMHDVFGNRLERAKGIVLIGVREVTKAAEGNH